MKFSTFLEVLTVILVILKLFGVLTISWWLVFLPALFYFGLILLVVFIMEIVKQSRNY